MLSPEMRLKQLRSNDKARKMFVLDIRTDNDAFLEHPEIEIARILRQTSYRIEEGEKSGKLRDGNGNKVGSFKLT